MNRHPFEIDPLGTPGDAEFDAPVESGARMADDSGGRRFGSRDSAEYVAPAKSGRRMADDSGGARFGHVETGEFGTPAAAGKAAVDGVGGGRWQVGIVPPNGPLPQRFGMPAPVLGGVRLALLLAAGLPLVVFGLGIDPEDLVGLSWGDLAAPLGALALVLLQRLFSLLRGAGGTAQDRQAAGRPIRPLAILVEPAGLTVLRLFGRFELSWSDLTGLARRDDGGWNVLVLHDGARFVLELPAAGWGRRLGEALAGAR